MLSLFDDRDVRVLQGGFPGDDPSDPDPVERRQDLRVQLRPAFRLHHDGLPAAPVLGRHPAHSRQFPDAVQVLVGRPVRLNLQDVALLHPGLEPVRGAERPDRAARDHRDPVAQLVGLGHVMGGEQDGGATGPQIGDRTAQIARRHRVDTDGRLVEEEDIGLVQQTAGDVQTLPHPARVALDTFPLPVGQADQVEEFGDPALLLAWFDPVQLGEVAQVVEGGEPVVQAPVAAEDVTDPAAYGHGVGRHVMAEDTSRAGGGQQQGVEHLDGRGLARTVGAEQSEQLAARHLETDAAHGLGRGAAGA